MSLDLTRYEGHTPHPWTLCGHVGHYDPADPLVLHKLSEADTNLLTDAPRLLARVVELDAANAAMLADILACTAILDADKSHSLTMCDDCWHVLEKYILEDES